MKAKTPKIEELLEAGVHFGHQARRWNPKMEPFIYSINKNIHIIDLEQTETLLKDACTFLYEIAKNGGKIIFVGTKKQARDIIESEAKQCGAMYVRERWIGGTMTNLKNIRKTLDRFLKLIRDREAGALEKYTKKERLLIDRDIIRFQTYYGGIATMKEVPQALFIVDPKREKTAVHEAKIQGIPVVALIDTNADPTGIDRIVPGNDDAIKSIALIVKAVGAAVSEGYSEYAKLQAEKLKDAEKEKEEATKKAAKAKEDEARKTEEAKKEVKVEAKVEVKSEEKPAEEKKPKGKKVKAEVKKRAN